MMLVDRKDDICRGIAGAGIDVEHEVRPEIGVEPYPALVGPAPILALRSGARLEGASLYAETFVRHDLVLVQVNQTGESRMRDRAMVALVEILDHDLPVGMYRIFPPLAKLERVHIRAARPENCG